jgi:hypothetical protein
MSRDMKTEPTHDADDLQLMRDARGAQLLPGPRVQAVMERNYVSLPAWFSAGQTASVLRQTGKSFALFGGPGGERLVTLAALEAVPPAKSACSCGSELGPGLAADASLDEALAVMERHQLDRVAVVMGRLLVGIVTRDAITDRLPTHAPRAGFRLAA